jgi:hypothetical protein
VIVCYRVAIESTIQSRRLCADFTRGLVFSKVTQKVISRRYHKFFNIGELPETAEDKIDLSKPHSILIKYGMYYRISNRISILIYTIDGTLVGPCKSNGKVRFATKSGFGKVTGLIYFISVEMLI